MAWCGTIAQPHRSCVLHYDIPALTAWRCRRSLPERRLGRIPHSRGREVHQPRFVAYSVALDVAGRSVTTCRGASTKRCSPALGPARAAASARPTTSLRGSMSRCAPRSSAAISPSTAASIDLGRDVRRHRRARFMGTAKAIVTRLGFRSTGAAAACESTDRGVDTATRRLAELGFGEWGASPAVGPDRRGGSMRAAQDGRQHEAAASPPAPSPRRRDKSPGRRARSRRAARASPVPCRMRAERSHDTKRSHQQSLTETQAEDVAAAGADRDADAIPGCARHRIRQRRADQSPP